MARRVLLTGASSFTGLWIAEALAAAGFEVMAPLLRARDAYEGVRLERVRRLERCAAVTFERPFGSQALLRDMRQGVDLLAHHAAQIEGYRDPGFDAAEAVRRNAAGAAEVLAALRQAGGGVLLLTGSVFEAGEGGEGPAAPYVTPYGLSKTLTSEAFAGFAADAGVRFGRFVIPSPYGPFEERRFSWHLFRSWYVGEAPQVRTPLYVRDHLPAPLLAQAYVTYVEALLAGGGAVARPSGWIASQGEFGRRLAHEAEARLGMACPLDLADQTVFDEPRVRVNDQPVPRDAWDEAAFWDDYVGWYADLHARGMLV
jgi:nucleoside-diphosphate-sugar epimerase